MKKYKLSTVGIILSVFLLGAVVLPTPVRATQTVVELQAQIQALMRQIVAQQETIDELQAQIQALVQALERVPAIRKVNIDNYQTPWTNGTAKTIRWDYSDLPQTGLKFKVGLYTNLNGGMWGNSVFVNAVGTSGTLTTSLSPRISEPYFNKDYFIMVRLYNTNGTEFRPQGKRVEAKGSQIFKVVPASTTDASIVTKEDQLASVYNTLENMLEGLLK